MITKLASFGEAMAGFSKAMDEKSAGFFGMDRLIPALIGGALLKKALPGVTRAAGRKGAATFFMIALAKFGKVLSSGLLKGILRIGTKMIGGPVGIILIALQLISWATGKTAKSARSSEDNLAELVDIERKRDQQRAGSSRFERLTLKVIQDSLFARTAMESIMSQHMGRQGDLLTDIRDDARDPRDPVKVGVPVR